jgi:Rieske Fe-S protein
MQCPKQTRRSLLAIEASLAAGRSAAAREDQSGSDERPQKGDLLVLSEGDHEGEVIKPRDRTLGGPPVHASSVNRKGSRLNEIIVIKLDSRRDGMDETRSCSADGIIAHSVICPHAGCPVSEWVKAEEGNKNVLKCPCHNSEFNPRESAQVVFGPVLRRLAALPLTVADGSLIVAATFVGKVGAPQPG